MIMKIFNSRIFYILISVLLSIVLFFNANLSLSQNQGKNVQGQSYSTTLQNIPIDIQYDSEKYFISGYTSTASVALTGYNQIEILKEESPDLRTLSLVADLKNLDVGTHKVPILVKDLSKSVNAQAMPGDITVTIEKKDTKTLKIQPVVDSSLIPDGYHLAEKTVSPEKITVTAGIESIKNIARVEAVLPSNVDLTKTSTVNVNLVSVNHSGKIVPAILSKQTADLTVKIEK